MKKPILLILFIFQTLFVFGQSRVLTENDYNKSGAIKLIFVTTKGEAVELAKKDIEKGKPFILLQSGISSIVFSTDSTFENKYNVYYYEQGCVGPDYELMKAYNFVIFDFLTNKYGKKWRREIRKDVIGFSEWKQKK